MFHAFFSARQSGGLRMAVKSQPTVTQLHVPELEMILDEVEHALGAEKAQKLRQLLYSHQTLTQLIQEKNISLARLRRILFGAQTERTPDAAGDRSGSPVKERRKPRRQTSDWPAATATPVRKSRRLAPRAAGGRPIMVEFPLRRTRVATAWW
jgi:transposase